MYVSNSLLVITGSLNAHQAFQVFEMYEFKEVNAIEGQAWKPHRLALLILLPLLN